MSSALLTKRYFTSAMGCQVAQQFNARDTLTIGIELYPRVDNKSVYSEKIQVQLKDGEVAELLDVLMMYRGEFSIGYHGTKKDKAITMRNQDNGLFVLGAQKSTGLQYNFVIEECNRYELLTLVAKTLAQRDGVTIKDALDLSRSLAQRRAQLHARKG